MSEPNKIDRRKFLALTGGAVGVTALALSGLRALGTQQPAVEFNESSCGVANQMGDKILVAYASRCGSTGEVAEAIGQALCVAGAAADVRLVEKVSDLSAYQAVIVGSAIRSNEWLPEAVEFVKMHRETLRRVPVAYFLTSLMVVQDTEETHRAAAACLDSMCEQVPQVQPVNVRAFAGKLDFDKLPFLYRFMWPFTAGGAVGAGDYRDWEAIRSWAAGLCPALLG